jgi:hypothetical protein
VALKEEWKEGQERVIYIKEVHPDHFELYLNWKYGGPIFQLAEPGITEFLLSAHLFVLGKRLLDREYQNRVIDAIVATTREEVEEKNSDGTIKLEYAYPSWDATVVIYSGTPKGSPARQLMMDFWTLKSNPTWFDGFAELQEALGDRHELGVELLYDISKAMSERKKDKDSAMTASKQLNSGVPSSYYHVEDKASATE